MRFRDVLASGRFVITAELGPPKGTNVDTMLSHAHHLKGVVDAVNVTDNQSAVMRMSSLAACALVKEQGLEPIYQLTCRDRNRLGLQSDLLGAAALGLENALALTGDYTTAGDHPQAKPVFDVESVQLIQMIRGLNAGHDMAGKELEGPTDFCVGAVVTPEANPLEPQLAKFDKKVRAGAEFFQTQAVFDLDRFASFMDVARRIIGGRQVKILASVVLLKSAGMARFLTRAIPGIIVPQLLIEELEAAGSPAAKGMEIAVRTIRELRSLCDGVHVMAMNAEDKVPHILEGAGLLPVVEVG